MRQEIKDYYIYPVSLAAALAASTQITQSISIEADANFTWVKSCYSATLAGAAVTSGARIVPLVTVQITDSGSGRNLQSAPVPIDSMAGYGELPFVLPIPRTFKARSSISFTFNNFSAATAYANLTLLLIGYKTFYMG